MLVSYYIVRTLREPLLLVGASAEVKTYASAAAALALLLLVPLYAAAFRRTNRNQSLLGQGFFIATSARYSLRDVAVSTSASPITCGPAFSA